MKVEELFLELSKCEAVEALALGGSRATEKCDERSDYDVYVYLENSLGEAERKKILSKYCSRMEIGNHYWETEDNCTLHNGIDIDIIYRDLNVFAADISKVVDECQAGNGYTTCMWHNLETCKIVYDKSGRLKKIQNQYDVPYPARLKKNIILKNMNLLSGVLPSYDLQIKKAADRLDFVSINHRVTEFLASYFDVIFAINEVTHPGEKRLVLLCKEQLRILPEDFEENLNKLFLAMYGENIMSVIEKMVFEMKKVIKL